MAWRRRERTTTILVKDVSIITKAGAKDRTVRRRRIWSAGERSPFSPTLMVISAAQEGEDPPITS
jgi:hypothetical protein